MRILHHHQSTRFQSCCWRLTLQVFHSADDDASPVGRSLPFVVSVQSSKDLAENLQYAHSQFIDTCVDIGILDVKLARECKGEDETGSNTGAGPTADGSGDGDGLSTGLASLYSALLSSPSPSAAASSSSSAADATVSGLMAKIATISPQDVSRLAKSIGAARALLAQTKRITLRLPQRQYGHAHYLQQQQQRRERQKEAIAAAASAQKSASAAGAAAGRGRARRGSEGSTATDPEATHVADKYSAGGAVAADGFDALSADPAVADAIWRSARDARYIAVLLHAGLLRSAHATAQKAREFSAGDVVPSSTADGSIAAASTALKSATSEDPALHFEWAGTFAFDQSTGADRSATAAPAPGAAPAASGGIGADALSTLLTTMSAHSRAVLQLHAETVGIMDECLQSAVLPSVLTHARLALLSGWRENYDGVSELLLPTAEEATGSGSGAGDAGVGTVLGALFRPSALASVAKALRLPAQAASALPLHVVLHGAQALRSYIRQSIAGNATADAWMKAAASADGTAPTGESSTTGDGSATEKDGTATAAAASSASNLVYVSEEYKAMSAEARARIAALESKIFGLLDTTAASTPAAAAADTDAGPMSQRSSADDSGTLGLVSLLVPPESLTAAVVSKISEAVDAAASKILSSDADGTGDIASKRETVRARVEKILSRLTPVLKHGSDTSEAAPSATDGKSSASASVSVRIFGSAANGFGSSNSDVDMVVSLRTPGIDASGGGSSATAAESLWIPSLVIDDAAALLRNAGMTNVEVRPGARVPIVQFKDPETGLQCDVCAGNDLALANTALLRAYSEADPRVRQLVAIVKAWARAHRLNDPSEASLSSYAIVLTVIAHCQSLQPPLLPCLQSIPASWPGPDGPTQDGDVGGAEHTAAAADDAAEGALGAVGDGVDSGDAARRGKGSGRRGGGGRGRGGQGGQSRASHPPNATSSSSPAAALPPTGTMLAPDGCPYDVSFWSPAAQGKSAAEVSQRKAALAAFCAQNTMSVGQLLLSYLWKYGVTFDTRRDAVAIRHATVTLSSELQEMQQHGANKSLGPGLSSLFGSSDLATAEDKLDSSADAAAASAATIITTTCTGAIDRYPVVLTHGWRSASGSAGGNTICIQDPIEPDFDVAHPLRAEAHRALRFEMLRAYCILVASATGNAGSGGGAGGAAQVDGTLDDAAAPQAKGSRKGGKPPRHTTQSSSSTSALPTLSLDDVATLLFAPLARASTERYQRQAAALRAARAAKAAGRQARLDKAAALAAAAAAAANMHSGAGYDGYGYPPEEFGGGIGVTGDGYSFGYGGGGYGNSGGGGSGSAQGYTGGSAYDGGYSALQQQQPPSYYGNASSSNAAADFAAIGSRYNQYTEYEAAASNPTASSAAASAGGRPSGYQPGSGSATATGAGASYGAGAGAADAASAYNSQQQQAGTYGASSTTGGGGSVYGSANAGAASYAPQQRSSSLYNYGGAGDGYTYGASSAATGGYGRSSTPAPAGGAAASRWSQPEEGNANYSYAYDSTNYNSNANAAGAYGGSAGTNTGGYGGNRYATSAGQQQQRNTSYNGNSYYAYGAGATGDSSVAGSGSNYGGAGGYSGTSQQQQAGGYYGTSTGAAGARSGNAGAMSSASGYPQSQPQQQLAGGYSSGGSGWNSAGQQQQQQQASTSWPTGAGGQAQAPATGYTSSAYDASLAGGGGSGAGGRYAGQAAAAATGWSHADTTGGWQGHQQPQQAQPGSSSTFASYASKPAQQGTSSSGWAQQGAAASSAGGWGQGQNQSQQQQTQTQAAAPAVGPTGLLRTPWSRPGAVTAVTAAAGSGTAGTGFSNYAANTASSQAAAPTASAAPVYAQQQQAAVPSTSNTTAATYETVQGDTRYRINVSYTNPEPTSSGSSQLQPQQQSAGGGGVWSSPSNSSTQQQSMQAAAAQYQQAAAYAAAQPAYGSSWNAAQAASAPVYGQQHQQQQQWATASYSQQPQASGYGAAQQQQPGRGGW